MKKNDAIITEARRRFHKRLVEKKVLAFVNGTASNADSTGDVSREIANRMAKMLNASSASKRLPPQVGGAEFERAVRDFLKETFPKLQHLRPGKWTIQQLGNRQNSSIPRFAQYAHLAYLAEVIKREKQLSSFLGNDYVVAPDIVITRALCSDEEINQGETYVDESVSRMADLREINKGLPLLHASISAKWTMRSDRAQNSRTEALNLIRNRKGHLPHIVVVTAEPLPSRLASLALGTGDLDCVYHFALNELRQALKEYGKGGRDDLVEQLETLVQGKRLKDISDLPLDLSC